MHQAGLLDYAVRKATQNNVKNPCFINNKKGGHAKDEPIFLNLRDFSGAFVILAFGMGSAVLVLILEFIVKHFLSKNFFLLCF